MRFTVVNALGKKALAKPLTVKHSNEVALSEKIYFFITFWGLGLQSLPQGRAMQGLWVQEWH